MTGVDTLGICGMLPDTTPSVVAFPHAGHDWFLRTGAGAVFGPGMPASPDHDLIEF
jgi:hypothetical protein